jgi:lysophospholipid hydrolase
MENKISVILSGGGLKAVSYLGFIKVLEENGIELDVVGAISGGALIATIMGLDKDYSYIKEVFSEELTFWKNL